MEISKPGLLGRRGRRYTFNRGEGKRDAHVIGERIVRVRAIFVTHVVILRKHMQK